jgi:hypothetical protein
MKRLAVVLAASLLGTGCIVSDDCNTRTVSIGWPTFLLADGTQTASCGAAGVSSVDVFMDGQSVGNFACTEGGVSVTSVPDGTHVFTVEGLDASSFIILRDEITLGATCGEQVVSVRPAEGTVELAYSFTPLNQCAADPSYLWFSIFDQVAGSVTVRIDENSSTADKTRYTCPDPIVFAMPAGTFTLQSIEERVLTAPGVYTVTGANCADGSFTVTGADVSTVDVALADASAACP